MRDVLASDQELVKGSSRVIRSPFSVESTPAVLGGWSFFADWVTGVSVTVSDEIQEMSLTGWIWACEQIIVQMVTSKGGLDVGDWDPLAI